VLAAVAAATGLTGCAHRPHVRPSQAVFACADANFYATGLRWARWSADDAWRFAAATPAGVPRSGSETLPCSFLKRRP
jgi:hypothetical protein